MMEVVDVRRILALAMCLMLIPAALAEVYVTEYWGAGEGRDYDLLITGDGMPLTPDGIYRYIFSLTPEGTPEAERVYGATLCDAGIEYDPQTAEEALYSSDMGRMALMDAQGRLLTDFMYENLLYFGGYLVFTLPGDDRLTGAMDLSGNVIVEPEYAGLRPLRDGRWLAAKPVRASATEAFFASLKGEYMDQTGYALFLIGAGGDERSLDLHTGDCWFDVDGTGVCRVNDVWEYGDQSVFIDSNGEVLFGRSFLSAEPFSGDYAVVETETGYGIIDRSGQFVVPALYDYIQSNPDTPFIATDASRIAVYDPENCVPRMDEDLAPAQDVSASPVSPELFLVRADKKRWLYRADGERLTALPDESYIWNYNRCDRAVSRLVLEGGDWPNDVARIIDLNGHAVSGDYPQINPVYWQDGHGRYIACRYDTYLDSNGESTPDWNSYRYGLLDENGQVLLPFVYDGLNALDFDRYWAVQGDKRGMIDGAGKWYYAISDYETLMD